MQKRKFLSMYFECCHVYQRIYINSDGTKYKGRCPKCMKQIAVRIGEGGSSQRSFRAG